MIAQRLNTENVYLNKHPGKSANSGIRTASIDGTLVK
jgi:hypothetical protein